MNKPSNAGGGDPVPIKQPLSPAKLVRYTIAFLAAAIAFACFYVFWAPTVGESLDCRIYFLVLIMWGLPCASFLSGAMHSYASFHQKHLGTIVTLSGPIVVFALVVGSGMRFAHCSSSARPAPSTFDVTIRLCERDGTPIYKPGTIILDLDNDRRTEEINTKGEANFKGVPERLSGNVVAVLVKVKGYKQDSNTVKLSAQAVYIRLIPMGEGNPDSQDADPIKKLMTSEAELVLSNSRDETAAAHYGALFAAAAWIADSGPPARIWRGRKEIMARFRNLERFVDLRHKLSSEPSIGDDGSATAEATTEFLTENAGPNKNPNGFGKEQWTFVKEGEKWKIRSFRYNAP